MKQQKYSYWRNLFISVDQLGNAIAGGEPDSTISARIGYNTEEIKPSFKYWKLLKLIVNWAFRPIDGPSHCKDAYESDKDENFHTGTKWWVRVGLLIIIVPSCALIGPVLRIRGVFKK